MNILKMTAIYWKSFTPTEKENHFKLRVYTGGLADETTAKKRLSKEIEKYYSKTGFSSSVVIECRRIWNWVSAYDFTVEFK